MGNVAFSVAALLSVVVSDVMAPSSIVTVVWYMIIMKGSKPFM